MVESISWLVSKKLYLLKNTSCTMVCHSKLTSGPVDYSVMLVVPGIDISSSCQECLHERHVSVDDGQVQWRESVSISSVRQRRRGHEHAVCARRPRRLACASATRRAVVERATETTVTHADC